MNIETESRVIRPKNTKLRRAKSVVMELGSSRIAAAMTGVAPSKPKPGMRLTMTLGKG